MKDTYTNMETFVASDGNTILVRKDRVLKFFLEDIEYNHSKLTEEEKQQEFLLNHLYADLVYKIYKQPLELYVGSTMTVFNPPSRPVREDYNKLLADGPSEHESEEAFNIRLERLKKQVEWLENNT